MPGAMTWINPGTARPGARWRHLPVAALPADVGTSATQLPAQGKVDEADPCRQALVQRLDLEKQDKSARRKHSPEYLARKGETCIDCHKGIAHSLPALAEVGSDE